MNWAPPGWFEAAEFDRVAASFDNPNWVDVTLHSYRARWEEAEPDPASAGLEAQVKSTRHLAVPTLYFQGEVDGVNPPQVSVGVAAKFTGPLERIVMPGVGHFPTREVPGLVGQRLAEHFASR